jgi:2-amino-4-hydroxy-6-hydroxymethyldihydropteridine diphosphokinase
MTIATLALGSNLGDRLQYLQSAIDALQALNDVAVKSISSVYETLPIGPAQPNYFNAVCIIETNLTAEQLLSQTQKIELDMKRTREIHWGPRTLDIDILTFDDQISADPRLTLPHPGAHMRMFVLIPWLEINPGATIPGHGSIKGLTARLDGDGVTKRDDLSLHLTLK